jgi:hypothetical protein
MRGRPIWGSLVPYDKVWRMGANDAAHIAIDRTVDLGGVTLRPGTYTLFLLPTANEWTLIVNRQTGMSGLDYNEKNDVGRVKMQLQPLQNPAEQFTIAVVNKNLAVAWAGTRGSVPITVK